MKCGMFSTRRLRRSSKHLVAQYRASFTTSVLSFDRDASDDDDDDDEEELDSGSYGTDSSASFDEAGRRR